MAELGAKAAFDSQRGQEAPGQVKVKARQEVKAAASHQGPAPDPLLCHRDRATRARLHQGTFLGRWEWC